MSSSELTDTHFDLAQAVVLFVDDEEHLRHAVAQTLNLADIQCECHASGASVLERVHPDFFGIVLSDIRMSGMDGTELMDQVHQRDAELPVTLITGHGDVELAVEMMHRGAYDFLEKPYDAKRLLDCVKRALEQRRLCLENRKLRALALGSDSLAMHLQGQSAAMRECREQLRSVATTDTDVLVIGDTGVGKNVLARQLHELSARRHK
ncbi:MAG: sigma-54-dependent Fis family transcriptional regulator, partial [Bacteroidota bacterium]